MQLNHLFKLKYEDKKKTVFLLITLMQKEEKHYNEFR